MDRAADGLKASGDALTAMYNAAAQVLPEALDRADRVLDLGERAVAALEVLSEAHAQQAGGWRCPRCKGYSYDQGAGGLCLPCAHDDAGE